ncbi:hypothetical protein ACFFRR_001773 [Megaselia abdita]
MKSLVFTSALLISVQLISADDCNKCRASGTNRFACAGYNSFQFCGVQSGKWVPMGSILTCEGKQVCSIKGESPCINATDANPSTCRQVCTKTCGKGDLYTCTDKNKFQICASNPPVKQVSCPTGQYCTDRFCQPKEMDGVSIKSSCDDDITKVNMDTFCDDKSMGSFLDPNDADCLKSIKCSYDAQSGEVTATENPDCAAGQQFSVRFGTCVAKRQDGCPPLKEVDENKAGNTNNVADDEE